MIGKVNTQEKIMYCFGAVISTLLVLMVIVQVTKAIN